MSEHDEFAVRDYREGFACLDTLMHALRHISKEYRDDMTRVEAMANFDARALLLNRQAALLNELELEYIYGSGAEQER